MKNDVVKTKHQDENIEEGLGANYDVDVIFFVSSSGHCSLDCHYCIVNPIVKHEPSLDISDLNYLLDAFPGKKAGMAFSGKGDFFAGYKKKERLLDKLLERDVQIGLDINGVMIHEFPELPDEKLDKIKVMNLTLHYEALKVKNSIKTWIKNSLILIDKLDNRGTEMLLGTILSPLVSNYWEEMLSFYKNEIFDKTGKKIVLIRDVNRKFSEEEEKKLNDLEDQYEYLIGRVRQVDFSKRFSKYKNVLCPAGVTYFRVWNDGKLEGCPYIPEKRDAGNVKNRDIQIRSGLFRCNQAKYCDCDVIARLGKMGYEQ